MAPNGLEMSRPASSRILLDEPRPQLAGSAPSSCSAANGGQSALLVGNEVEVLEKAHLEDLHQIAEGKGADNYSLASYRDHSS